MIARLVFLLTALALALSLGIAFRQASWRDQVRAKQTQVSQRDAEITSKLDQLHARLRENEKREAQLHAQIAALATTAPEAQPVRATPPLNPQQRLDTDPKLQLQMAKIRGNGLKLNYAPFYRMQGMSASEISTFEDAVLRREEEQNDLFATMRTKNLPNGDPAIGTLLSAAMNRYREAQTQLLGKEGYDQLVEYENTRPLREFIDGVAGAATVAGAPFSPEQAEQLIRLMAASAPKKPRGQRGPALVQQVDWAVVDAEAREILSPEQLHAFQTLESRGLNYQSSRAMTRMNEVITRAAEAERKASSVKATGG